ncbi:MAG: DUF2715 domain-containing protein [Treponema sp.]
MKKTIILSCLFFSLLQFFYANDTSFSSTETKNEYIISPSIGFASIGFNTGLDFMYRHRTGFLVLCNLDVSVPITAMGGIVAAGELLFGYSIKRNNLYVGFSGGFWGGGGESFQGYELSYKYAPSGKITMTHYPAFFNFFAIRNDYTYFFTQRIGITASHSYGIGIHAGPWITFELLTMFGFMGKVGVAIRV